MKEKLILLTSPELSLCGRTPSLSICLRCSQVLQTLCEHLRNCETQRPDCTSRCAKGKNRAAPLVKCCFSREKSESPKVTQLIRQRSSVLRTTHCSGPVTLPFLAYPPPHSSPPPSWRPSCPSRCSTVGGRWPKPQGRPLFASEWLQGGGPGFVQQYSQNLWAPTAGALLILDLVTSWCQDGFHSSRHHIILPPSDQAFQGGRGWGCGED